MYEYIIKRILILFPSIFLVILVNFLIVHLAPGNPIYHLMDDYIGNVHSNNSTNFYQEISEELGEKYKINLPIYKQFFLMISSYIRFDLGRSIITDEKVIDILKRVAPTSLLMVSISVITIYLFAIPIGIKSASSISKGLYSKFFDLTMSVLSSIPSFLFELIVLKLFSHAGVFKIFSTSGIMLSSLKNGDLSYKILLYLKHMTLPIISISLDELVFVTVVIRGALINESGKCYVVTAFAKGLSKKMVIYKHVFRNAISTILHTAPHTVLKLVTISSLVIEKIFSIEGIGLTAHESLARRDYPVVLAIIYILSILASILHLLADIFQMLSDRNIDCGRL